MLKIELNCRAAGRLITLLVAILAAVDARGQTAGSAPPLVIRGPENAAEIEAQREAAEGIVTESELAMGRRLDPSHRTRIIDRLASGRAGAFASRPGEGLTSTLGDTGSDLVYTPVTPCRVFDTRIRFRERRWIPACHAASWSPGPSASKPRAARRVAAACPSARPRRS